MPAGLAGDLAWEPQCISQERCCRAAETSNPETQGLNTTNVYFFSGHLFDVD